LYEFVIIELAKEKYQQTKERKNIEIEK